MFGLAPFLGAEDRERRPLNAPVETTVVVWNQHNANYNDRGAKTINVVLFTDDEEVFRKDGVQIPWEAGKDTFVKVGVPTVVTDTVRIEIVECVNGNAGLAEIEFFRDERNLAKRRRVKVNGVWEDNSECAGDKLTDGITTSGKHLTGYWLAPVLEKAWAEIRVNTRS